MDHKALAESFRSAAELEFRFLVDELGFRIQDAKPRWIHYRSPRAYVNIYHDGNFGVQVEFGIPPDSHPVAGARSWRSRLLGRNRSVPASHGVAGSSPYALSDVLLALSDKYSLPADIQELVKAAKDSPGQYFRWFGAETPDQVRTTVRRLAELTKEYASGLLRGETEAFRAMDVYGAERTEAWHRRMWLNELPAELAAECQGLPIDQLERRRNEYHKSNILSTHGEAVADIRDLPADEFMKTYGSRQVKRGGA